MTGYESKKKAAQDKLVVTDIDGHVVRDVRKPKKAQPAQRPWVGLTDMEWFEWWRESKVADETEAEIDFADFLIIAQAVLAKLKEKNNG